MTVWNGLKRFKRRIDKCVAQDAQHDQDTQVQDFGAQDAHAQEDAQDQDLQVQDTHVQDPGDQNRLYPPITSQSWFWSIWLWSNIWY